MRSFAAWFAKADAWCRRLAGLSLRDLADCCYRDWFEDGMSPKAAAKMALRNEGWE